MGLGVLQGVNEDTHGKALPRACPPAVRQAAAAPPPSSSPHHCCWPSSLSAIAPFSSELCFLVPLGGGCQVPLVLSLSVHSFVHSSVKPLLCARDPGSCQVVGNCFQEWLWAAWAGPHLLPLCNLNVTPFPEPQAHPSNCYLRTVRADLEVLRGTPLLFLKAYLTHPSASRLEGPQPPQSRGDSQSHP